MTIAITVIATLGAMFLLAGTYQAGVRKGTVTTLNEMRLAVRLAGLQGAVTGPPPIHEGLLPSN